MARERRGLSQKTVAGDLGLSTKSKSTVSDWEKGQTVPKLHQLKALARLYRVPLNVFTNPEPDAQERLDQLARAAGDLEREDWETGDRDDH